MRDATKCQHSPEHEVSSKQLLLTRFSPRHFPDFWSTFRHFPDRRQIPGQFRVFHLFDTSGHLMYALLSCTKSKYTMLLLNRYQYAIRLYIPHSQQIQLLLSDAFWCNNDKADKTAMYTRGSLRTKQSASRLAPKNQLSLHRSCSA